MSIQTHACSALVRGKCVNGFPFTPGCLVFQVLGAGREHWLVKTKPPICCDEQLAGELYPETGRPSTGDGNG